MDGWRLDVVHMLGEGGGARNNLQLSPASLRRKQTQPEAFVFGEHFGDARQWLQADAEDAAMNYRGLPSRSGDSSPIPISLTIRRR